MNFVFVSPNYPATYFKWVQALKSHGINVLGIGDTPYNDLNPALKDSLTEYYFLGDLSNMDAMIKAVGYFESKYGHIDYLESNNEWWLNSDAKLREWFNIRSGFFPADMEHIKAKSAMKEYFRRGGAKTMRYVLVDGPKDLDKGLEFAKEVGFPLFVKPNVGVGAASSYALHNEEELRHFFTNELPETYIMEEYIDGYIVSFDGICNDQGDVVFCTTDHFPTPVADIVNDAMDFLYYNNSFELPMNDINAKEFEKVGSAVVKSFGIKKRFFHIEFFVLNSDKPGFAKKGEFVALECNMRPAGGYTPDLIDFGMSCSVYDIYADVIAYNENRQYMGHEKYYAAAVCRRDSNHYAHSLEEIDAKYSGVISMKGRYPDHMAVAMGNTFYFARFKNYDDMIEFDSFVRAKAN